MSLIDTDTTFWLADQSTTRGERSPLASLSILKATAMQYRNYEIDIPDRNCPFSYRYVHNNYDGPEDRRIGFGSSILDCKNAIDDAIDDAIYCEQCDSTGIVHIGNRPYPNDPRSIDETFSEECEKCSQIREKLLKPAKS